MNETKEATYEGWAIVELMGHRRYGGRVREQSMFGANMLRIDVPNGDGDADGFTTHFYGGQTIYGLHPTSEELARALAKRSRPEPISAWELPKLGAGARAAPEPEQIDFDHAKEEDP